MKQILRNLLLLICVVSTTSMIFAQKYHGNYDVLLESGTRTFTKNVEDFINAPDLTAEEARRNTFYRFLQFEEVPNDAQLEQIANTGIRLLNYIPHKTYIAAIPTNMNFQQLRAIKVRAVVEIGVNDKLNQYLKDEDYPSWSVEGNELLLHVKLYEARNRKQLLSAMFGLGAKVLHISYRDNLIQIKISKDPASVSTLANLPFVSYVETIDPPGEPEDINGRGLQRSNMLNESSANGLKFDGSGIAVHVRDDGPVGPHIDFQGRLEHVGNVFTPTNDTHHADGVAGVFAAAGNLDPFAEAGATGSYIYVTNYNSTFQDTTYGLHLNHGVKVTNSSYSNGCNAGYTTTTQTVDNQIWNSKTLMHVFSAGNSNNQDCGYGAGTQWGNITGGHKIGKNVIATANLNSIGILQNSSSRGPANDGRIKPDMSAYGAGQISTDPNNQYSPFGGTSSASPSGAGTYTMLYHAYKELNGGTEPESGLIKAMVMNTAQDLGNEGPDFKFGWGLYHGGRAYQLLEDNRYASGTVGQGASTPHLFTIPNNVLEARIMVYWMDPAASPSAAKALVNDLDMTVSGNGVNALPLVLDETPNTITLNNPAVPGVDNLNNVEQVRLYNPTAGTYVVNVTGSVVPFGATNYYVLYEYIYDDITLVYPNGGEGLDPGKTARIHWDAPNTPGGFTLEYSTDGGSNWNTITNNAGSLYRIYNWNVPDDITDNALFRVSRGGISDVSDTTFTIVGTPSNIDFVAVCQDSMLVSWDAVDGATSYDVMLLGDKYMDSVANTTSTSAVIPITSFWTTKWVSVRARVNDGLGTRAIAVRYNGGLLNCITPTADFTTSDPNCFDLTFTSTSVNALSYNWDFGPNATPQTANTEGPHTVTFSDASPQNVSLSVRHHVLADAKSVAVPIEGSPDAAFSYSENNGLVDFSDITTDGTSYFWDFGDGTTSTEAIPNQKIYVNSGTYTVSLTITEGDCSSTYSTDINVNITTSLVERWNVNVFPNPSSGLFTVELNGILGNVNLSIIDATAREIRTWNHAGVDSGWRTNIDASSFAKGVYILRVQSGDDVRNFKVVIN